MRQIICALVFSCSAVLVADVWTNRAGKVFSARLLSVDDAHARFVFPEDGATNALQLSKLHPDSVKEVCRRLGFVALPPRFAAMFNRACEDFARIENLVEDGLLTPDQARNRKNAVLKAFVGFCCEKGCSAEIAAGLSSRIETGRTSSSTPETQGARPCRGVGFLEK